MACWLFEKHKTILFVPYECLTIPWHEQSKLRQHYELKMIAKIYYFIKNNDIRKRKKTPHQNIKMMKSYVSIEKTIPPKHCIDEWVL